MPVGVRCKRQTGVKDPLPGPSPVTRPRPLARTLARTPARTLSDQPSARVHTPTLARSQISPQLARALACCQVSPQLARTQSDQPSARSRTPLALPLVARRQLRLHACTSHAYMRICSDMLVPTPPTAAHHCGPPVDSRDRSGLNPLNTLALLQLRPTPSD
jgi:hypothetical protein